MNLNEPPPLRLAGLIWSLGAVFYLLAFFQRVAPAVMTEELMRDFGISAAGLGNLSALYFYSYVFMQIPTGILADRMGPRRLLSLGALIAGIGTLFFAVAANMFWAGLGRFLIGGSVAVAFVGLMKLTTSWFPERFFALLTGLALLTGVIGAVFGGPPLRLLMDLFHWRQVLTASAGLTFLLSAAIWISVRDHPHEKGYRDVLGQGHQVPDRPGLNLFRGLLEVVKSPNVVLLFLIPGGLIGCVLTFAGLWGVPFLTTHRHLSTTEASFMTSSIMVAWGLGGPVFGWASDRIRRRKSLLFLGCLGALSAWTVSFYVVNLPLSLLFGTLFLAGFCCGSVIIAFAFGKESVEPARAGTVSGMINMGIMLGPTVMQPLVGWILDMQWQGEMANGVRVYSLQAYQTGFSAMLAWLAVSMLLCLLTRETFCRQRSL